MTVGTKETVMEAKSLMTKQFECDDVGPLCEYLGCKVNYDMIKRVICLTQPVLLQSLSDEYELCEGKTPTTPATPNSILTKKNDDVLLSEAEASKYRTMVGKLLYLTKSQPEICNAVRELTKFSKEPTKSASEALELTI
jgi:hypothetical protein